MKTLKVDAERRQVTTDNIKSVTVELEMSDIIVIHTALRELHENDPDGDIVDIDSVAVLEKFRKMVWAFENSHNNIELDVPKQPDPFNGLKDPEDIRNALVKEFNESPVPAPAPVPWNSPLRPFPAPNFPHWNPERPFPADPSYRYPSPNYKLRLVWQGSC